MSYCLAEGVLTQKLGAQLVLMHVLKGQYFELNGTGAIVLDEVLAGADAETTALLLSRRFNIELARAQADVSTLLKNLIDQALLILK